MELDDPVAKVLPKAHVPPAVAQEPVLGGAGLLHLGDCASFYIFTPAFHCQVQYAQDDRGTGQVQDWLHTATGNSQGTV